MDSEISRRILQSVDALFDRQIEFLVELSKHPSTRGNEQSAQDFMATAFAERGYAVDRWNIEVQDIKYLTGFSPVIGDYDEAVNVVGSHYAASHKGRSLILNGHVDVVPPGPLDMWTSHPFEPRIEGNWIYGRGVGDMKAGLASNLFALDALREIEFAPSADVYIQSVVEEECTGNGALACLQRGYRADAALIPEPFAEKLVDAQVGVLWFQVHIKGLPTHVAYAGSGSNAIEAIVPLIAALHSLEERWNDPSRRCRHYLSHGHALNLNVGKIAGGDWTSSVPAWCVFEVRMGVFPDQDLDEAKREIASTIAQAAREHPLLRENLPDITWIGFHAQGYALADDESEIAAAAIAELGHAHAAVTGKKLDRIAITATTDARLFGLYGGIPTLVYGPVAEAIHGFNERVDLESMRRVTQATALFIAGWCGLERV